jgi:hypothetical protein
MDSEKLAAAVREVKENVDRIMDTAELDRKTEDRDELFDAKTLLGVLAHIVDGMPIEKAFGSPGDWGYGTAIGNALASRA